MSAPHQLLMPKLGLTMEEGRIARWAVQPGARFSAGDIVVVIETDKIANDVEAPAAGVLVEILAAEGAVVPVSTPIARWNLDGDRPAPPPDVRGSPPRGRDQPRPTLDAGGTQPHHHVAQDRPATAGSLTQRVLSTPYARRLARESGIDIAKISGTGPRGRIKGEDVLRVSASRTQSPSRSLPEAVAGGCQGTSSGAAHDIGPGFGAGPSARGPAHAPTIAVAPLAPARKEQLVHLGDGRAPADLVPEAGIHRALSQAYIEIDTRGIREIEHSLPGRMPPLLRTGLVVMAALRALDGSKDDAVGVEIATAHGSRVIPISAGPRLSLTGLVGQIEAQPATNDSAMDRLQGTLLIVPGTADAAHFAPAAPTGWAAALGLGAERELLRRTLDGAIADAHAMTLALSYDAAQICNGAAIAFLKSLKLQLEEPMAMLAS